MLKYLTKLVSSKQVRPPEDTSSKISPSTEDLLSLNVSNNYNNDGVLLQVFDDFINVCGGEEKLKNKTTYEVTQEFIKPLTKIKNLSYTNYIRILNPTIVNVHKANILICHSWSYKFLDVVDAIKNYIIKNNMNQEKVYIYFDAFSINQNNINEITTDWLTLSYAKTIKNIKHTLVVISPNDEMTVFKRSFAIFEIYCTIHNHLKLSITLCNRDMIEYRALMCESPLSALNKILLAIKFKDSSTYNNVRDNLVSAVETMSPIDTIDKTIRKRIHDCLIELMTQEIDLEEDGGAQKLRLLSTVATLHKSRGSFEQAESLFLQNLDKMKLKLGHSHPEVYTFMNNLANFYTKANRFEQAEALHLEILAYRTANGGDLDLETLTTKNNLACLYYSQQKFEQARLYYHSCFIGRKEILGESYKSTLETQNNLALTIVELAKKTNNFHLFNEAEELYLSCLTRRKLVLGENHVLVLETKNDLGSLYYLRQDLDKAEILFEEIYEKINGNRIMNSRRYLTALNNHANIYFKRGNLLKAQQLFKQAYDEYLLNIGEHEKNLDFLCCCHNLASVYFSLEKHQEAANLLEECLKKRVKYLGDTNPSTLATMNLFGLVLCKMGKYDVAQPLLSFVLEHKVDNVMIIPKNIKNGSSPIHKSSPIKPANKTSNNNQFTKNKKSPLRARK